jgi:ABC transport system ATP-binding/permease protein
MFKLVIQDDEGKTTVVPLIRDEITIGRKEGNTIRLTERNVSRRHARILRNNGEVHIEDLGSYNGIRVNNARIAERVSLRVSDQVQIGDYKLYLKAEGVEQVDDARTMPIERVDSSGTPTDVMPAQAVAPTAPLAVPAIAATPPSGVQVVANPARTIAAVAPTDTDPQGRPVVTPAAVAALSASPAYGKLVVLSSNFAGKEFELTRPQMIVGRTDENDLVINHRSISRNHAKLVREPDTGRYTISDLQSANGVRVNGQDYGKVEMRRGDVIDLGHVRLRFVEAGEDFVFSRDAVITDVPESGGRKGLWIALALGLLVLGGGAAYFLTRGDGKPDIAGVGTNGGGGGTGSEVKVVDAQQQVAVAPLVDAAAAVGEVDAAPAAGSVAAELNAECLTAQTNKRWVDLEDCAGRLAAVDKPKSDELKQRAVREARAEVDLRTLSEAVNNADLKAARAKFAAIGDGSVYRKEADGLLRRLEKSILDDLINDLRRFKADCRGYNIRLRQAEVSHGADIANDARSKVKCVAEPIARPVPQGCTADSCPAGQKCGDDGKCAKVAATPPVTPPALQCEMPAIEAAEHAGDQYNAVGNYAAAMTAYESQLKCKPALGQKAYMAACKARRVADARRYFKTHIAKDNQNYMSQICLKEGIDPRL